MKPAFDGLRDLDLRIQEMSRTDSPAEVFKALKEACRLAAPRGAIFLVRHGRIRGWGSHGYDPAAAEAQRGFDCGLGQGWLGALGATPEVSVSTRPADADGPAFGQPVADEAVGGAVRIQGKPLALVVVERRAGETPWHPELVSALVTIAELRLELDLARRRLQDVPASRPVAAEPRPERPAEPASMRTEEPAPGSPAPEDAGTPAAEEPSGLEPAPEPPGEGQSELEAARRYARLVATDIRLYNEEAVVLGRRNGDLGLRLEEHLDRGKETFLRRHGDLGPAGLDLLHEAYVQVLAAGDPALIPESVTR